VTLTLTNARLIGERGLLGSVINIVIRDGVISDIEFVGHTSAMKLQGSLEGEVIDLGGRHVIPGLWDNHVHFGQWAQNRQRLDVSGKASASETAAFVAEVVTANPPEGNELVGFGWRGSDWADAPHKDLLDQRLPDVPVVLFSFDLHSAWLNTAALAAYGVTSETGILLEEACFDIGRRVSEMPDDLLDDWVADAAAEAAKRGIVGIVDFEHAWNVAHWRRRITGGLTSLRVDFGLWPEHLDRAIETGLRTGDIIASTEGLLAVGPFKVIVDGSIGSQTAYCFNAYPGATGAHARGILNWPLVDLVNLLSKAVQAGFVPALHAIGDNANAVVLDAFDAVGVGGTIEHAEYMRPEDIMRMAELGIMASVQPEHLVMDADQIRGLWPESPSQFYAFGDMQRLGIRLLFGSDAPIAPLNPWNAIAAAVTRTDGRGEPYAPEQALTREQALAASTRSTIAVGQPADLAVLEFDPLTCSEDELRHMPVAATFVAGRMTHSAL